MPNQFTTGLTDPHVAGRGIRKGPLPVAFATLLSESDEHAVASALDEQVTQAIRSIAHVDRFVFLQTLPKTLTGMIMRRLLREIVADGAPRSDTSAPDDADPTQTPVDALSGAIRTTR